MTWIKICGTTNPEDAAAAVEAGADALGFIFAPSPRRVDPITARTIVQGLPPEVDKVGVFVNEPLPQVRELVEAVGLTAAQLHGDEDPDYAHQLRAEVTQHRTRFRVFKTLAITPGFEGLLRRFLADPAPDGLLLDSPPGDNDAARGGTGRSFDWNRAAEFLPGVPERVRIVLAGGLQPSNVAQALQQVRPWGVDVCTGVEREPGRKDPLKIMAFVHAVRAAERSP